MKKIYNILLLAAVALGFAACADVPAPFDINYGTDASFGKKLPYKSANLNSGWTTVIADGYVNNPWSMGSSYVQASSSQKWDGTNRSNKEVCGYLISPALNTTCSSGKVKLSFDMCIGYSSYDSNYKDHIGMFISKDYDGSNYSNANWTKLEFTVPAKSVNSTWALETIDEVQIPDEFVNHDSVYVSFYFYGASSGSATWELENFLIQEGEAASTPDTPDTGDVTPQGDGTQANPYNVAGAVAYINTLGSDTESANEVYVKGKVLSNTTTAATITNYGNMTFTMIDEGGSEDVKFTAFQVYGPGKAKFTSVDQIKAGDEVVVCGKVVNYKGNTPETVGKGASYVVSINSGSDTPDTPTGDGDGSKAKPYNVAEIIAFTSKLAADTNSDPVYFKGKVCSIKEISTSYGNASFYISEDGTTSGDQFYVFRCLDLGNQKFTSEDAVKVGDEVIIYGPVVNYKGNTPETAGNSCYIYSINGKTADGGGDDTPDTPGTSEGVAISGTTVTLTNSAVTAGSDTETIDLESYASKNEWTNAGEVSTVNGTNCTVTFSCGENTKYPPKYYTATKGVRCYANNTITIEGSSKAIAKVVMNCDEYNGTQYVGQATATVSFSGNTAVYTNAGTGTTQLRVKTIDITYAQ